MQPSPGRPARTLGQALGVGIMSILVLHHLNDQDAFGNINLTFLLVYGQSFTQLGGFATTLHFQKENDKEQHLRDGAGTKMTRIPAIASMDKKKYSSAYKIRTRVASPLPRMLKRLLGL